MVAAGGPHYVYKQTLLGLKGCFADHWDRICQTIKKIVPDAKIGGCNYSPSINRDQCVSFYREWAKARYKPDYITCTMFPYQEAENPTKMNAIRLSLEQFSLTILEQFRSILSDAGFHECPVVVQEWNISFIQRNSLNDMAASASILVDQMADLLGEVEMACYWYASDILAGDYDADRILNGACGLISTDGIRKPSYYALSFISRLLPLLVERGDNYIISKNDRGHYTILLYNNKSLNHTYYSVDEASIDIYDEKKIFTECDSLELTITLSGVKNTEYQIRKQTFGPSSGSILDEWKNMGCNSKISLNDLSYLRQKCVPSRKIEQITAINGKLVLTELLHAHEIMLVEVLRS